MNGLDVYLDPADGKPKKWTPPSNPPSDDYLARLECCKHGVDDGACKECYDDTALLRQALEALNHINVTDRADIIKALKERLK